jgi:hypothetical protein
MGVCGHKIDFASGQIRHVWGFPAAQTVGLLGFLLSKIEVERAGLIGDFVIDFDPVGFC